MSRVALYTLCGLLMGLMLYIGAYWIILTTHGLNISYDNIVLLHDENPALWSLELFPLIIAVIAYVLAWSFTVVQEKTASEVERVRKESAEIFSFTEKLSGGQLDADFELADRDDDLLKSLINLRDTLKRNKTEEEQRRREDAQRNWAAEGLAKFGELMRQNNDNLKELAYTIVNNLVEYLGANQSGLFLLNSDDENDTYLEQIAAYAYERRKFVDNVKIKPGDGLVGTCALEKETIYLTDVPDNYVQITSGLGKANPRNIIIVPLKLEENILGIIEIASFKVLEKYEVEFVEKLGESIASTLSNVKINARTNVLLAQSQDQAEALKSQEEEMRQNMEEMAATQEEMKRKEMEMEGLIYAIDNTVLKAEFDIDEGLLTANNRFLSLMGYKTDEIKGKNVNTFIPDLDREEHINIWNNVIIEGKPYQGINKRVTKSDDEVWVLMSAKYLQV